MSDLEFQKILVVSSGHIPRAQALLLELMALDFSQAKEDEKGMEVLNYGEGLLLYVYPPNSTEEVTEKFMLETFPEWKDLGAEVRTLYALAQKHECTYLKLDRDGPEIEGMELLEW